MTDAVGADGKSPQEQAAFLALSARAEGTNIHPQTLLATDYLNHFNEIVMLFEMIADMPECFEDMQAWRPRSYQDHFRASQFRDRDLAIEAYEYVPACFRRAFEDVVEQMNLVIASSVERIGASLESGETDALRFYCTEVAVGLQKLIDVASAIIHGSTPRFDQGQIDRLLGR
jgi:hypothetical protein